MVGRSASRRRQVTDNADCDTVDPALMTEESPLAGIANHVRGGAARRCPWLRCFAFSDHPSPVRENFLKSRCSGFCLTRGSCGRSPPRSLLLRTLHFAEREPDHVPEAAAQPRVLFSPLRHFRHLSEEEMVVGGPVDNFRGVSAM